MKESFIADLSPGTPVNTTFLVQGKERKVSRSGSPYLDLVLQDSGGFIRAKLWDCDNFNLDFDADDVVEVKAAVEEYQGALELRVEEIHRWRNPEVDLRDFLPCSKRDPDEMYSGLLERLSGMTESPLRDLLFEVMTDPAIMEKFKVAPAATSYHHAYLGGLLEHVTSLVALGDKVCDHYQSLDRDLVIAGLVLHDLGKIEELSFTRGFRYSTRGQLVGHMAIALEILREKMRAIPAFPESLKDQIGHIILSHHGRPEFGSSKEPMFPEALAVHYLDDLDSKLESMRAQYEADKHRTGDWTTRNRALGRELLKKGVGSHGLSD